MTDKQQANSLAALVAEMRWFHSIDLGGGVVTPGVKSQEMLRLESLTFLDPVDFEGRSVIDIGAWNGFYSFEAKRRGAARVLATDHFVWNLPHFLGRRGFDLARDALGLNVEAMDIDVPDLSPARVGMFDVVLFLGVFYHLPDPIAGLAIAASLAKEVLILETHIDLMDVPRPAMVYYPGMELGGDGSNWWGPNVLCILELLKNLGFAAVDVRPSLGAPQRGVFHAWRTPRAEYRDPGMVGENEYVELSRRLSESEAERNVLSQQLLASDQMLAELCDEISKMNCDSAGPINTLDAIRILGNARRILDHPVVKFVRRMT